MACLTSVVGLVATVAIAVAVVVAVVAMMARSWHRVGTARQEIDISIYERAIVLTPIVPTSWNTAPYFWLLDVIEMIKTAANCKAWQCKQTNIRMCFPLLLVSRGSGGRLGPLGLGQQWQKGEQPPSLHPILQVHLWGNSKGAWWGAMFLAARPTLFFSALLAGGYSSPKLSLPGRSRRLVHIHMLIHSCGCLLDRVYVVRSLAFLPHTYAWSRPPGRMLLGDLRGAGRVTG